MAKALQVNSSKMCEGKKVSLLNGMKAGMMKLLHKDEQIPANGNTVGKSYL